MPASEIEQLVRLMGRLPGLGPRSARRAVLALLRRRDALLVPLVERLQECARLVTVCEICGNLDTTQPCAICADPARARGPLLVVEEVADLWAMERAGGFAGRYHVLGGTLNALQSIGPEALGVDRLVTRVIEHEVVEVVLALGATVDGQTTAHYLGERLRPTAAKVTRLGYGLPVGGELNYLDEGTLSAALRSRQPLG